MTPNARFQALPEAGATEERTLEAVACKPLFGQALGRDSSQGFCPFVGPERTASASRCCSSIELGRECLLRVMCKESVDLMPRDSRGGERW